MLKSLRLKLLSAVLLGALSLPTLATYDEAMQAYLSGDYARALTLFEAERKLQDSAEISLWIGWSQLKLGGVDQAEKAFSRVLSERPNQAEATAGLGYVRLRRGETAEADRLFVESLEVDPKNVDALVGRGWVAYRGDHLVRARELFQAALEIRPDYAEAVEMVEKLRHLETPEETYPERSPLVRPEQTAIAFQAGTDYLEVRQGKSWKPIFVQGMNLGAALPGKHPSEFPQSRAYYAEWLQQMAAMKANVVRLYTILPPAFYQAFWDYHQNPKNPPLWLVHGVWTELPEDDDFRGVEFEGQFVEEMHRVVDLLHGQADIPKRPGHASGSYTADVSPWVLAYLIGREWEPFSVVAFNDLHPNLQFHGRYVSCTRGNPMEAWLAQMCDTMAVYEADKYNAQRPFSFTNWPTLDPLHHPTESTKEEEMALMAARGESSDRELREYDNDAVGVSVKSFDLSPEWKAGMYASYHAYPYYPDFMVLDPEYQKAQDSQGPNAYMGYLRDLKSYYGNIPVLISEYGVPSSRGNAHIQPNGMHHGGHTEQEQAAVDARLTRDLYEARCGGGMMFAWIDEWFKKNWAVIDVEIPLERNRMWLNALDAEQNYGMVAMRAGSRSHSLSGNLKEWSEGQEMARSEGEGSLKALIADWDEAYLYLRLDLSSSPDFSQTGYWIGIDTYDRKLGDARLPNGAASDSGLEFALKLEGENSELFVSHSYRPFVTVPIRGTKGEVAYLRNPAPASVASATPTFESIVMESNRRRIGRDGTVYQPIRQNWGKLRQGTVKTNTLADWNYDAKRLFIEVRLPWGLLNVTDPSSHQVLHTPLATGDLNTISTDGFRFTVSTYPVSAPGQSLETLTSDQLFRWPNWEVPTYRAELKPAYSLMKKTFESFGGTPPVR